MQLSPSATLQISHLGSRSCDASLFLRLWPSYISIERTLLIGILIRWEQVHSYRFINTKYMAERQADCLAVVWMEPHSTGQLGTLVDYINYMFSILISDNS